MRLFRLASAIYAEIRRNPTNIGQEFVRHNIGQTCAIAFPEAMVLTQTESGPWRPTGGDGFERI